MPQGKVKIKRSRVGRRRWAPLLKFLTETMQNAKSERVRMQAAQRLADVLTLREQREQIELRAAMRLAQADTEQPTAPEDAEPVLLTPLPAQDAEEAARRFLARIKEGDSNE